MSDQMTFPGLPEPTSSPGSEAGNTPSSLPAGPQIGPSGRAAAHASRSAPRDAALAQQTLDTFGQSSPASLESAALQSCLENRLRHALAGIGSPVFVLTWRRWTMRSGPPICALRALAPLTSDSGSIGWATPVARDFRDTGDLSGSMERANGTVRDDTLPRQAFLSGWSTPLASDANERRQTSEGFNPLTQQAQLAGWATPVVADAKNAQSTTTDFNQLSKQAQLAGWPTPTAIEQLDTPEKKAARGSNPGLTLATAAKYAGWPTPCTADDRNRGTDSPAIHRRAELGKQLNLSMVAGLSGIAPCGSGARTAKNGSLNPAFSRWLMGYPAAWLWLAPRSRPSPRTKKKSATSQESEPSEGSATRSSRKSRRRS